MNKRQEKKVVWKKVKEENQFTFDSSPSVFSPQNTGPKTWLSDQFMISLGKGFEGTSDSFIINVVKTVM